MTMMRTHSKAKLEKREQLRDVPPLHLLPPLALALPEKSSEAPAPAGALCELSKLLNFDALTPSLTPPGSVGRRRSSMATATSTPKGFHLRRLKKFTSSSTLSTITDHQEEDEDSSTSPSTLLSSSHTTGKSGKKSSSWQDLNKSSITSHILPCLTPLQPLSASPIGSNIATNNNSSTSPSIIAVPPCFTALANMDLTTTPRGLSIIANMNSSSSNESGVSSDSSSYANGKGSLATKRLRVRSLSSPFRLKSPPEKEAVMHFPFRSIRRVSVALPHPLSPSPSSQGVHLLTPLLSATLPYLLSLSLKRYKHAPSI